MEIINNEFHDFLLILMATIIWLPSFQSFSLQEWNGISVKVIFSPFRKFVPISVDCLVTGFGFHPEIEILIFDSSQSLDSALFLETRALIFLDSENTVLLWNLLAQMHNFHLSSVVYYQTSSLYGGLLWPSSLPQGCLHERCWGCIVLFVSFIAQLKSCSCSAFQRPTL